MDSDLAEAVSALKEACETRKLPVVLEKADPAKIEELRKLLKIPARFRAFLGGANPIELETVTPVERIRFFPADKLTEEQLGYAIPAEGEEPNAAWRKSWIIIARSALLGDPYFLDTSKLDAEGDCPVFSVMTGTGQLKPVLCASSLEQFLRILTASIEVAAGFGDALMDDDDERTYREALAPKIKPIDPAALRAGHWT